MSISPDLRKLRNLVRRRNALALEYQWELGRLAHEFDGTDAAFAAIVGDSHAAVSLARRVYVAYVIKRDASHLRELPGLTWSHFHVVRTHRKRVSLLRWASREAKSVRELDDRAKAE